MSTKPVSSTVCWLLGVVSRRVPKLVVSVLSLLFFAFTLIFFRLLLGKLNHKSAPFADTLAELKKDLGSLRGSHE